jgi:RNA methyltransferase, TrmH family
MIKVIHSIKDEKIILARAVKSRQGRQEHRKLLLEGEDILDWALANHVAVEYVLISDKASSKTAEKYSARAGEVYSTSDGILKKVSDTNYLIPVIGVAEVPSRRDGFRAEFVVVLDALQDFGNIGTIVRTCQAFGIKKIISTTSDLDIYQRKTIEASRGGVFTTDLECFSSPLETIGYLKKQGYQIVAASPRGAELQSLVELRRQPVALIVGNETSGISPEFEKCADYLIQIPMFHAVESLNVGVATGIGIYELKLKQVLAMIEERIKSTLGRELNVAGNLVQQALDAELKKISELSSRQVIFMMVLKCDRKMPVADMRRQFGLLENEVEGFLKPLLASGQVAIAGGELELTRQGEDVLAKLWPIVENTEGKIFSDYSAEDVAIFFGRLRRIQEKCIAITRGI